MSYEPGNKKCLFLSKELIFEFKLFESAILSALWPDFQKKKKSGENWSIWSKNSIVYLIKLTFQINSSEVVIDLKTLFYIK